MGDRDTIGVQNREILWHNAANATNGKQRKIETKNTHISFSFVFRKHLPTHTSAHANTENVKKSINVINSKTTNFIDSDSKQKKREANRFI